MEATQKKSSFPYKPYLACSTERVPATVQKNLQAD
jgi:hypothetical protein